ncbi:MAG: winged helix-turn-helix transcriptional regulator [Edaphobacter sp.]
MRDMSIENIEQVLRIIDLLQRKWTIHILWAVQLEPVRLSTLKRRFPSASKKALRAGLRDLEQARVVVRRDLTKVVLHVEYHLVEETRETVCIVLEKLAAFGGKIGATEL